MPLLLIVASLAAASPVPQDAPATRRSPNVLEQVPVAKEPGEFDRRAIPIKIAGVQLGVPMSNVREALSREGWVVEEASRYRFRARRGGGILTVVADDTIANRASVVEYLDGTSTTSPVASIRAYAPILGRPAMIAPKGDEVRWGSASCTSGDGCLSVRKTAAGTLYRLQVRLPSGGLPRDMPRMVVSRPARR